MSHEEPRTPQEEADDRIVEALLVHQHNARAAAERNDRVRRVLDRLEEPGPAVLPIARARRWTRHVAWAVAALVCLTAGLLLMVTTTRPARASVSDILGALDRKGDRTFRIHVEPRDPRLEPKATLDGALLYLRDGRLYLLERPDPAGGMQYDGFDGQSSWRVNSGRVVEERTGLGAGGLGISAAMSGAISEDLTGEIAQIGTGYDIEVFDQAPLASGGTFAHLVARHKRANPLPGPPTIEIWADPVTGMPHLIVFDENPPGVPGAPPHRMVFELVNEDPLPADWFAARRHVR